MVSRDSFLASSTKPQVLIRMASELAWSSVMVKPDLKRSPRRTSPSTVFLGQPRETMLTLRGSAVSSTATDEVAGVVTSRKVLDLGMHTLWSLDLCIDDEVGMCIMPCILYLRFSTMNLQIPKVDNFKTESWISNIVFSIFYSYVWYK